MFTVEEIKAELGIDYDDASVDKRLERYIKVAEEWLDGAIENCDKSDERAKQLALLVIETLFDRNIGTTSKENATLEKLKKDFLMQLQWEKKSGNV